jgi:hypothetical protein
LARRGTERHGTARNGTGRLSVPGATVGRVTRLPNPYTVPVVTVETAGQLLGMSRRAAYRAASDGSLPTILVAGALRVPVADLYRLLRLPVPVRTIAPVIDR